MGKGGSGGAHSGGGGGGHGGGGHGGHAGGHNGGGRGGSHGGGGHGGHAGGHSGGGGGGSHGGGGHSGGHGHAGGGGGKGSGHSGFTQVNATGTPIYRADAGANPAAAGYHQVNTGGGALFPPYREVLSHFGMAFALILLVLVLAYIGYRVYSSPTQAKADADDPRYQTLRISENVAFEDNTKSGSKAAKSASKSSKKKN